MKNKIIIFNQLEQDNCNQMQECISNLHSVEIIQKKSFDYKNSESNRKAPYISDLINFLLKLYTLERLKKNKIFQTFYFINENVYICMDNSTEIAECWTKEI